MVKASKQRAKSTKDVGNRASGHLPSPDHRIPVGGRRHFHYSPSSSCHKTQYGYDYTKAKGNLSFTLPSRSFSVIRLAPAPLEAGPPGEQGLLQHQAVLQDAKESGTWACFASALFKRPSTGVDILMGQQIRA